MSVRKRGSRWWYDFSVNHVRYRGPLPKARTKRQAEELEDRIKLSVYDGEEINRKAVTLGRFVDEVYWPWALTDYSRAEKSVGSHVRVVKAYFGSMPLSEITPARIEAFKQERMKTPTRWGGQRAPATVNRDLRTLSRYYRRRGKTWSSKRIPLAVSRCSKWTTGVSDSSAKRKKTSWWRTWKNITPVCFR